MVVGVHEFSARRCEAIQKLMHNELFQEFLEFLKESREQTHKAMYSVRDDKDMARLQGQAETLYDIITACYSAQTFDPSSVKIGMLEGLNPEHIAKQ